MGFGNPVWRAVAAATTMGASELTQKKPFQDPLKDRPIGGASGSVLRFAPGGSLLTGAVDVGAQLQKKPEENLTASASASAAPKAPDLDDATKSVDAANDAERRRRATIGRASTILTKFEPSALRTNRRYLGGA